MALLVCQRSSKVVLDVGVHDGSEVVEAAVPEQVNDEHLRRRGEERPFLRSDLNRRAWLRSFTTPTSDWKTSGPYLSVLSSKRQKSVSRTSRRNCGNERKQHKKGSVSMSKTFFENENRNKG